MNKGPIKQSRVVQASPVYYGWLILFAASIGLIMTTPGQTIGVSVFLDKILVDLDLSRQRVSLLYTLGTLMASFALPFIGRFIDSWGPRVAVIIISSLFALACVWMGLVQGVFTLFIGFLLIRGLGQGALGLVSLYIVNIWFVRRRGLAVGITGLGFAMAIAFFPLLIEGLIQAFGWRRAYMFLGGLVLVTILPLGALLFRGHPERFGLKPDGGLVTDTPVDEANYTLAQARKTGVFWLFVAGNVCVAALSTGLLFHHYSIMAEGGLDRVNAATVFVALGFIIAGANFLTGVLVDRVNPRFLLFFAMVFQALSLGMASLVTGQVSATAYGILLGLTQGMSAAITASVFAYYFGRAHIGAIKGVVTTFAQAGTAFGPFLFALGLNWTDSYRPVLLLSMVIPLGIGILALMLRGSVPSMKI